MEVIARISWILPESRNLLCRRLKASRLAVVSNRCVCPPALSRVMGVVVQSQPRWKRGQIQPSGIARASARPPLGDLYGS